MFAAKLKEVNARLREWDAAELERQTHQHVPVGKHDLTRCRRRDQFVGLRVPHVQIGVHNAEPAAQMGYDKEARVDVGKRRR